MNKLFFLFIPLLFFIGCEEEDSNDDNLNNSTTCVEGVWRVQSIDASGYDYLLCFCDYVSGACGEFDDSCYDFVFESNAYFHTLVNGEFSNGGTYQADCPIGPGYTIMLHMNDGPEFDEATWAMEVQSISNTTMIVDLNIDYTSSDPNYYYDYGGLLTFSKVD